jgi:diguanylate cyclase (GGDEF)-like protein
MSVDGLARQLLDELKYKYGFPPRVAAADVKGQLASRGLGQSSALAQQVATVYLTIVEKVLDGFAGRLLEQGPALGYSTPQAIRQVIVDAHRDLFDLTRGLVRDEVPGDYGKLSAAAVDDKRTHVWQHLERMIELHALETFPVQAARALDQKFGILLGPQQAGVDFAVRAEAAGVVANRVTLLFLDLDNFKALNTRFTNAKVDQTILPEAQRLVHKLIQGRGDAYLHGGDEIVIVVSNLDEDEARAFAEKLRRSFEAHKFAVDSETVQLTASIGVASWPVDGSTYQAVLEAANRAQVDAKRSKNAVVIAGDR